MCELCNRRPSPFPEEAHIISLVDPNAICLTIWRTEIRLIKGAIERGL